jgi:hypothetical protein
MKSLNITKVEEGPQNYPFYVGEYIDRSEGVRETFSAWTYQDVLRYFSNAAIEFRKEMAKERLH